MIKSIIFELLFNKETCIRSLVNIQVLRIFQNIKYNNKKIKHFDSQCLVMHFWNKRSNMVQDMMLKENNNLCMSAVHHSSLLLITFLLQHTLWWPHRLLDDTIDHQISACVTVCLYCTMTQDMRACVYAHAQHRNRVESNMITWAHLS